MFKFRQKAMLFALCALAGLVMESNGLVSSSGSARAESVHENVAADHNSFLRIGFASKGASNTRHVKLGLDKSMIVELPGEVSDVLVSNPKIVDAVVHTSRRVYLIGMKVGQANVFFFDKRGGQMATLEMKIERDLKGLGMTLKRLIPGSDIRLETVGDNIVMTGSVRNPSDASRASDIAKRLFKGNKKEQVLNMINVKAKEQVMLKVVVAEMNRKLAKKIGVDIANSFAGRNISGDVLNNAVLEMSEDKDPFGFPYRRNTLEFEPSALGLSFGGGSMSIMANIKILETNGLIRTLAEPNLTALSGETAKFHAGGEFGYVVTKNTPAGVIYTVEYRPYGVQLNFTPMVMSEGRISLKIKSDVSEIDGTVTAGDVSFPTISKREAETTIELPSGGAMVIGGMISEKTKQNLEGLPGLMKLPVLGQLFRSQSFQKEETELVVIVTPYLVNPVARKKLVRPDKGFAPASEDQFNFLGRMNRVYGRREETPEIQEVRRPQNYGFIVE